jgi:hypothetical protein
MRRKIEPVSYPTIDILALAFAVQRVTGKFQQHDENVTSETEFKPSNRRLMQEHVDGNIVNILEQDRENALAAIDTLVNHKVLSTLKEQTLTAFYDKLIATIQQPTVTSREFSLLAYAPNISTNIVVKQAKETKLQELTYASQHFGTLKSTLEFTITVVDTKYISRLDCHIVFGYTPDNNGVVYFTHDKDNTVDGTYIGRVKEHTVDEWRNNVNVTRFSHVKKHLTVEQETSTV